MYFRRLIFLILTVGIVAPVWAGGELEVAHWWTSAGEARAVAEIQKAFEAAGGKWKNSGIVGGGGEKLTEVLRARAAAGTPPAVVQVFMGPNVRRWAEEGVLVDLSDVAEEGRWKEKLPETINRLIQYEGRYMAAPINAHRINSMWINAKILREAGGDAPTSWAEFIEIAEKIRDRGYIPLALGGQAWQIAALFENVLLGLGGVDFHKSAIQELAPEALISPTMIEIFEMLRKLKAFTDKDSPGRSWDAATRMVMEG